MAYELSWSFLVNQSYTPASTVDACRYAQWWFGSALVSGTVWGLSNTIQNPGFETAGGDAANPANWTAGSSGSANFIVVGRANASFPPISTAFEGSWLYQWNINNGAGAGWRDITQTISAATFNAAPSQMTLQMGTQNAWSSTADPTYWPNLSVAVWLTAYDAGAVQLAQVKFRLAGGYNGADTFDDTYRINVFNASTWQTFTIADMKSALIAALGGNLPNLSTVNITIRYSTAGASGWGNILVLDNIRWIQPKDGAWTIFGSSDGTSYYSLDSQDHLGFTGSYVSGNFLRNSAGNHTWFVLKSPVINGSNWYLIVDFNTTQDYQVNFWFCKAAPTGGSLSARPTSTDEWQTSAGAINFVNATQGTTVMRQSIGMTSRGDFWTSFIKNGNTQCERVIHVQGPADYNASDQYPIWTYCRYDANGYNNPALIGGANNFARQWDGSNITGNLQPIVAGFGRFDMTDNVTGKYNVFPFHCALHQSTSSWCYRGRLQDCFITPGGSIPAFNLSITESAVVKYANLASVWVPSSAAIS